MEGLRRINFQNSKGEKQRNGSNLAIHTYNLDEILFDSLNRAAIQKLSTTDKVKLVSKIHENKMTFNDAFLAACYILTATNNLLYERFKSPIERACGRISLSDSREYSKIRADHIGTELLVTLREKEIYAGLSPYEIAGLAAGAMIDLLYRIDSDQVMDTCGMGGDRGFNSIKTLNVSTLSGIVNAALGVKVMKHGSYANTSPIGSTDFIEETGAKICMGSIKDYSECLEGTCFCYSDANEAKTIHDISHLIMGETVNHIIGPMTTPVSRKTRLNRVLGVNHNVSTEDIARAYQMLGQEGYQNVGNVCVVAGLADNFECDPAKNLSEQARQFTVLDELTPFNSVISIVREGVFEGNFIISPKDFGISIEVEDILARGTREQCYSDNIKALAGTCQKKAEYLAMNAALVYFTAKFLSREDSVVNGKPNPYHLRAAYEKCLDAIKNGAALSKLNEYVEKTGGKFKNV